MNLKEKFEQDIARQEERIRKDAFKFDDETQEEFEDKIARRIKLTVTACYRANELPGINAVSIDFGGSVNWEGFKVIRRRVDQLDNVYVSRA
jgi:hypothetical protein